MILIFNWQKIKLAWAKRRLTPRIVLEIKPNSNAEISTLNNMKTLFQALHHLSFANKTQFLAKRSFYSLEIVANKSEGICFLLIVPRHQKQTVMRLIASYDWTIRVSQVSDYQWLETKFIRLLNFKSASKQADVKTFKDRENHDSLSYLLSGMVQLEDGDQIVYQIVYKPIKAGAAGLFSSLLSKLGQMPLSLLTNIIHPIQGVEVAKISTSKPTSKPDELFQINLRCLIQASSQRVLNQYTQSLRSALDLLAKFKVSYKTGKFNLACFRLRLIEPLKSGLYLNAEQLASLYHLPDLRSVSFENLDTTLSKTLPAHPKTNQSKEDGVIIGENVHQNRRTPISLSALERSRHVYIIGGTGSGKTTLLKYKIIQDIESDRGVAVVDPHGDLSTELLGYIPKNRIKDVIYFNPSDYNHPIGINLLEIPPKLKDKELLRAKDLVAETVVSIFRKVFTEENKGGHRIEYVLRNTVHTALCIEDATFFTIFKLLNDNSYNKKIVHSVLKDENLKNFWLNEIHKAGEYQRVKMQAGVTAKMGRFLFSQATRSVFEKTDNCLNFKEVINSSKILICNFSKGLLGEDTSRLFGATILAKIQLAILEQANMSENKRIPFYLYVDEFQNFITKGFIEMLSESRKYKLNLILAEQSTQQQDSQKLTEVILANVGNIIAFRSGSPMDARLILPLFEPYISLPEFLNLPAYNFYAKLSAITPKEPISGITKLTPTPPYKQRRQAVIQSSRRKFVDKSK